MTFERPEHRLIAQVLASMDAEFLLRCRCYFGGGTAIVLQNGEYRLSRDIDFLCANTDGYRELRNAARQSGPAGFFGPDVEALRDFRVDQYGIRSIIALNGQAIRFEIVREARIGLQGVFDPALGVPVLSLEDQFAEKLLANADRHRDKDVACRDAIDLGYLLQQSRTIPVTAIEKATDAYGPDIAKALVSVLHGLSSPQEIRRVADALVMTERDVSEASERLRMAVTTAWPGLELGQPLS